jgi:geranylgeranyl pyrophosphate synthase
MRKRITPREALKIYALKTAPAFEAALMAGVRLAGDPGPFREPVARFARHLGAAYQMLNDLDDWEMDPANKRRKGTDFFSGRPTVLWALALKNLDPKGRRKLRSLPESEMPEHEKIDRAEALYERADAFGQTRTLIAKHHARACQAADRVGHEALGHLLHFLADAILDGRPLAIVEEQ